MPRIRVRVGVVECRVIHQRAAQEYQHLMHRHPAPRRPARVARLVSGVFAACAGVGMLAVISILIAVGVGVTILALALDY